MTECRVRSGSIEIGFSFSLQDFLEERRQNATIYEHLLNEESILTSQNDIKSSVKSISIRWSEILRKSDDLASIYDFQLRAWSNFESDFNSFRDQTFFQLEQRIQSNCSTDFNKFIDLNRIQAAINDLRVRRNSANRRSK